MVQIVNLRTARKQRDRDTKRAAGDVSAAKHGEAKPLRDQRKAQAEQDARKLDGHRKDD
ncbi:DUF4169 family protein [Paracoccus sp. JM45]|uniref:DUF4169 family protein n=1 Tax=Paracoccus sp. JM45 TaxID=2283626 RepID=UPI000E6C0BC8|nr:DUF4169 family protein [Paracoccus sp. JM45]RJE81471.1 DUF4169 family protein [Paracoccus sp. JM45]